jgi:hypothetical protein
MKLPTSDRPRRAGDLYRTLPFGMVIRAMIIGPIGRSLPDFSGNIPRWRSAP